MAFIPAYILFLFAIIAIDYGAARGLEAAPPRRRRWLLIASLAANFGLLGLFKYFDWFAGTAAVLSHWLGAGGIEPPRLGWVLPIGLSFHTFQSVSYVVEVYRGRFRAERNLLVYANYVLFFPQLVAGPIERPQHVLPQLRQLQPWSSDNFVAGFELILIGLVKKVVMADNLADYVDFVFGHPAAAGGLDVLLGTVAFAAQIYGDFAGYSDIARGSARMLGIELMVNFDAPYLARSLREFWQRWHISLSSWFRDYVYIPLGGSRGTPGQTAGNILLVFALSGLWHGANWTFVVWGLWHAVGMLGQDWFFSRVKWPAVQRVTTLGIVLVGWIFFRAASVGDALHLLRQLASSTERWFRWGDAQQLTVGWATIAAVVLALCRAGFGRTLAAQWGALRLSARAALWNLSILTVVFLGNHGSRTFIYFQF